MQLLETVCTRYSCKVNPINRSAADPLQQFGLAETSKREVWAYPYATI